MGLTDKLKNLSKKAETLAVEHKDQIQSATQKAEQAIDKRTGGRYHDKIERPAPRPTACSTASSRRPRRKSPPRALLLTPLRCRRRPSVKRAKRKLYLRGRPRTFWRTF